MNLLIAAKEAAETGDYIKLLEYIPKVIDNYRKGLYTLNEMQFAIDYIIEYYQKIEK